MSDTDEPEYEAPQVRVARGITMLDQRVPEWRGLIEPDRLDINTGSACILGQIYDEYADGVERLKLTHADALSMGFFPFHTLGLGNDHDAERDNAELTAVWRSEIDRAAQG